jgi:hypothetical protein
MTQMPLFPDQEEEKEYLPQVIPANLSPKQVSAEERKILATSGRTYLELFNKNDLMYAFSKMLVVTFPLDLMKFSMTWKVKATQQGRLYCQLKRVVHRTEEIGSGLSQETWATPTTMDHLPPRSEEATEKMQKGHRKGRSRPSNLREQVDEKTMMMWPTPDASPRGARRNQNGHQVTLQDAVAGHTPEARKLMGMWPTPRASLGMTMKLTKNMAKLRHKKYLETEMAYQIHKEMFPTPTANEDAAGRPGGKMQKMLGNHPEVRNKGEGTLNADWVEWLMGYPRGWTSL